MDFLSLIATAVALALDAFAVSAAVTASLPRVTGRHVFRLAWHFGLFQALMPVLGWLGGAALARRLGLFDHWIAFALLSALGGRMIWQSFGAEVQRTAGADPTRGLSLVALSVATSIDALAVGLSLGLMGVVIWYPAVVIGVVALALTSVGALIGHRVGRALGRWASRAGGAVLILIGARIVVEHLLGW
jgi:putative Mn2+ efflux pump MntP